MCLTMFQTLIYPSSVAYDYSVELLHWSCVLGSICVGVSMWLGWRGIRVAGRSNNGESACNTDYYLRFLTSFVVFIVG